MATSQTAPTLIIGLGGIGSQIIAKVERMATAEQRKSLSFVAFDTDVNDLNRLKEQGYTGHFVQTSSRLTVGEYLEIDQLSRDRWFPVNNILSRKAVSEGAGQVRAVSRLAFMSTIREGRMNELHNAINTLYKLNGQTTEQALRVIIVSTLAGGTGSGLILPAALYLRDYLQTHYQLSASIVRGFFLLPDVLYRIIPTESERNNLRCNAYATLREINAFLLKGDGGLPPQYQNSVTLELPATGSHDLRNIDVMPFDFCFLFDSQNMDGGELNTFEDYIGHAANCIFAQSIGPTSAKSNSSEDNVVLQLVSDFGRNRFCGAGSALLEYPYEGVRDFIAFSWAHDIMGSQWLAADKEYREQKRLEKDKAARGLGGTEIRRADVYISYVGARVKTDPFCKMIADACSVFDDTQTEVIENKWDRYAAEVVIFCDGHGIHQNQTIQTKSGMITNRLNQTNLTENANLLTILSEIRAYRLTVDNIYERAARMIGEGLYNGEKDMISMDGTEAFFLESALKDSAGNALHPNAVRYFLYNMAALAQAKVAEYDRLGNQCREEIDSTIAQLGKEQPPVKGMFSKKKLLESSRKRKRALVKVMQLLDGPDGYRQAYVRREVFRVAAIYLNAMSEKYEVFYDNLEINLDNLNYQISHLKVRYKIDRGNAIRYVCANEACLDDFAARLVSPAGLVELPNRFSNQIYSAIRTAMRETRNTGRMSARRSAANSRMPAGPVNNEWHKKIFNHNVLGFWRSLVAESCAAAIDMDIISAVKAEAEVLMDSKRKAADPAYQDTYLLEVISETRKLAEPFLSIEKDVEQRVNETCTYNEYVETKIDPRRRDDILPNGIPVGDEQLDCYRLLFYKAIYGKRATQIPKFAPQKESQTAPKEQGEYFRAYYERITQINPNSGQSKVITPHIDKNWHIISQIPELDEAEHSRQMREIMTALYDGMLFMYIQYESYGNNKKKYVYKADMADSAAELNGFNAMTSLDFIVLNNTPCDKFYELVEAITINPIIVQDILRRVGKIRQRETTERKLLARSEFMKYLGKFCVRSIPLPGPHSLLSIPVFYMLSAPVDEFNSSLPELLIDVTMKFIRDNLLWLIDPVDLDKYLEDLLWSQYELFEQNIAALAAMTGTPYTIVASHHLVNDIRRNLREYYDRLGNASRVGQLDNRLP